MAAPAAQPASSKSSKKKAAKALERTESPAPSTASAPADKATDSQDETFESPYIKELQKNIRNTNKKLANASKTDTLLSQHSGKSLDELVATKIINTDQKAQILKKPALQAQVAQYEEQLAQYQKVHEQYQARAAADQAGLAKSLEKAKEDALSEAQADFKTSQHDNLLVLSQFLRLAAYRRGEAKDPESDESQAIEGVLLAIYSGDEGAVSSMLKLIEGSVDQIVSVPGEQLQTTYSTVKTLAQNYQAPSYADGTEAPETEQETEAPSDPAVEDASATEVDAAGDSAPTNEHAESEPATNGLATANVSDDAANAVAESRSDATNINETSISHEWVDVAVPVEAESGPDATPAPAPAADKQSWADDHPDPVPVPEAAPAKADPNEGFHQVQRNRGRQEREGGGGRGRGRGEWRGRGGHRGDGRGRGRGRGDRGDRGSGIPSRGPRRNEESS